MSDFSTWYKQVPQFTRYWLSATVGFSVLAKIGIIPAGLLYLDSTLVFQKFQVISSRSSGGFFQVFCLPDMAAANFDLLLPNRLSFPHELLFPLQLLVEA